MTTTEPPPFDPDDPFSVHFHRDPLGCVGVSLVVLGDGPTVAEAAAAWEESVDWLRGEGRQVDLIFMAVDRAAPRLGESIQVAADGALRPIIAIAAASTPPPREAWEPLLKALDQADHVWMRRPTGLPLAAWWWLARALRRLVLGVPLMDVHAPLSLHRVEKLRAIPLQSGSSFVDVELPAKATFLGHVLDEANAPALARPTWNRGRLRDARRLFKAPTFRRGPVEGSGPLEPPQGEPERDRGPGEEDRQGPQDPLMAEPGPLQHDEPQRGDELGQR
jgi:hypothetical protein